MTPEKLPTRTYTYLNASMHHERVTPPLQDSHLAGCRMELVTVGLPLERWQRCVPRTLPLPVGMDLDEKPFPLRRRSICLRFSSVPVSRPIGLRVKRYVWLTRRTILQLLRASVQGQLTKPQLTLIVFAGPEAYPSFVRHAERCTYTSVVIRRAPWQRRGRRPRPPLPHGCGSCGKEACLLLGLPHHSGVTSRMCCIGSD